jgi:hypothetical protein
MCQWATDLARNQELAVGAMHDMPLPHVANWFIQLSHRRSYTVVAGMGGGVMIPNAISYTELDAWQRITGNPADPFLIETITTMDMSYIAEKNRQSHKNSKGGTARTYQALGEYCNGERVEECRKIFGDNLERICSTCPD